MRKRSNASLRPFEQLNGFVRSLKDAVVCVDDRQRILAFNSAAEAMFGFSVGEVSGQSFKVLLPIDGHASFDEVCALSTDARSARPAAVLHNQSRGVRAGVARLPYSTSIRTIDCQRKDGSTFQVETTISSLFIVEPMVTVVLRDVTERRRSERNNALLAAVANSTAEAIISVGGDGLIATWNRAAERVLGYPGHDVLGRDAGVLEIFDANGPRAFWQENAQSAPTEFEAQMRRKDGALIDVVICASSIATEDAALGGVCAVLRDCTEEKRRKRQDEHLMREISHRAKNNLAIISAIIRETGHRSGSVDDFESKLSSRVSCIGYAHDSLIRLNWRGAELCQLFECQLQPFCDPWAGQCKMEGPRVIIAAKATHMVGLAIHELAANARQFGALSSPHGKVDINWKLDESVEGAKVLQLAWIESNGPTVVNRNDRGFGSVVLEKLTPEFLDSDADFSFEPTGVHWKISIPEMHFQLAAVP